MSFEDETVRDGGNRQRCRRRVAAMAQRGAAADQPLHLSVGRGDVGTVTALLSHDADPNHPAGSGDTPLHFAARLPRPDITQLLLLHGANPRATNVQGDTPLHVAAAHARHAHVQLLLDEGALPNAKNNLGKTPLWTVCQNGSWIEDEEAQQAQSAALFARSNALMVGGQHAEAEKLLLASSELAVDDEDRRDCCEVARMLVQRGAQVNCVDTALGDTPLTVAAAQASVAYQAYLRANPPPEKPEQQPWDQEPEPQPQALQDEYLAFGYRVRVQLNLMLLLLKAGANHEHANAAGHTALTLTTELPAIQELLLGKSKADEDLLLAAATGIMATAREARDSGASLSKTAAHGTSTALHLAACFGRVKRGLHRPAESSSVMVKFLLDEGADVNVARSGDKLTPLCMAAQAGHSHIVQVLLQRGADRDQPNHRGLTPLWYAARNGHAAVAEVLLHASCTNACSQHCTKRHAGCRVDRGNSDGMSPLWIAAASGHADAVRVLLVHRASIDRTDNSGATPLWIACKRGHEAVAQLLARGLGVVHHSDLDSPTRLNQMHPRANADR